MAAMGGARPGLSGDPARADTLWSDKPSGQARSSVRIVTDISRENINKWGIHYINIFFVTV